MRASKPSKAASDVPRVPRRFLFALWLYATLEGIGSARAITRLTQEHDAYRWICGGVQVNDHTVADFRSQQGDVLDDLLTDNLASLMAVGVVKLKAAAQDGVRVRASAGAASFRREEKLESLLAAASERVAALKTQVDDDLGADSRRKALAQARAATAGCVNAHARNCGLVLLPVRGLKKVKAVVLPFVLAHNLMRMIRLVPEMVGIVTARPGIPERSG